MRRKETKRQAKEKKEGDEKTEEKTLDIIPKAEEKKSKEEEIKMDNKPKDAKKRHSREN